MSYTLKGSKGTTVEFKPMDNGVIDKESESYSSTVTSNPIESGAVINDHITNAAGTLTISGVVVGGEAAITALKSLRDSRDTITYTGMTQMKDLVFTSLKFDRTSQNKDGATFSATLKQIQRAPTKKATKKAKQTMTAQDAGKSKKKKTKKTKKKGKKTKSTKSVSKSSAKKKKKAYKGSKNQSPKTRKTGSYDGLSKKK